MRPPFSIPEEANMADKKTDEAEKNADEAAPKNSAAKVKRVRFLTHFFERGAPKYEADLSNPPAKHYPVTQETSSQVAAGRAEIVTVEMDTEAHAAEQKAAIDALNGAWAQTRKAEAMARARGELKD
jgi:hypothetical protein